MALFICELCMYVCMSALDPVPRIAVGENKAQIDALLRYELKNVLLD